MNTPMKTPLMTAFALAAAMFTTGCDDQVDPEADDWQLAEMIEICEELEGDCDEEIEVFLAEVEGVGAAEADVAPVDADNPADFWIPPQCTHCGDNQPIDDLTGDQRIEPHEQDRTPIDDVVWNTADQTTPCSPEGTGVDQLGI
jgi:hypothetical protein